MMSELNENWPINLYSAEQVREIDHIAIEDAGISGYALMQRAAKFSYQCLKKHWPQARSIAVICGGGNNAGDGYVLANLASAAGMEVVVFHLLDPATLQGDAATAYQSLLANNVQSSAFTSAALCNIDVIVDAVFGTGLDRNVEGHISDVITAVNNAAIAVLAIDIPSGLNANTGQVMNVAVNADVSATFVGLKRGMFTGQGLEYSGKILFDDLAVPATAYQRLAGPLVSRLQLSAFDRALKPRPRHAHKGHFGHVLVVGGDAGYLGAARMAAEAAARVGAGLVSVATRASHAGLLSVARPEIMAHGVETLADLLPLIKRADVVTIGSGLGQSTWARWLLAHVMESDLPLVIDADALNLLAEGDDQSAGNWVITPHPGEAARLLKTDPQTIERDRFCAIDLLHEKFRGPVVLKGSGTLIADTAGAVFVCDAGNPGMSSGGMGDVLAGVIAGLMAQDIEIDQATKMGVCLHATAADRAANSGERGLLAMDLMPHLRHLVNLI